MPVKQIAVVSNNTESMAENGDSTVGVNQGLEVGTEQFEWQTNVLRETGEHSCGDEALNTGADLNGGGDCGEAGLAKGGTDGGPVGQGSDETRTVTETELEPLEVSDAGDSVDTKRVCFGEAQVTHVDADTVILGETDTITDRQTETHVNVTIIHTPTNMAGTGPPTDSQPSDKPPNSRSNGKKKDKPTPLKKKDSVAKETLHANSPTPMSTERCDSSLSNSSVDVCRICQCDSCEIQSDSPLLTPCLCAGSLKYIHQACLQKWIKSSDKMSCELCQFEYQMTKKTKPFREWERLEMTQAERRKVVCSVTFHVIAITCVVWSLYVLIDRTTEEVEAGSLLWPFWTKLIVVAIGFTGGVVFMYVQCKMYLNLCKKWRMYNKVIIISSISEAHREKSNHIGLQRISEKQRQLEEGHVTTLFNVVNETESV